MVTFSFSPNLLFSLEFRPLVSQVLVNKSLPTPIEICSETTGILVIRMSSLGLSSLPLD